MDIARTTIKTMLDEADAILVQRNLSGLPLVAAFKVTSNGVDYSVQITPYAAVQYDGLKEIQ